MSQSFATGDVRADMQRAGTRYEDERGAQAGQNVGLAGGLVATGANTDRGRHGESREVTLFFGFARPEAVLAMAACEVAAEMTDRALVAQALSFGLTPCTGLWTLGFRREEERGTADARGIVAPLPLRLASPDFGDVGWLAGD